MAILFEVFKACTTDGWSKDGFRTAKQAEKFLLPHLIGGPQPELVARLKDSTGREVTGRITSAAVPMELDYAEKHGYGRWRDGHTPHDSYFEPIRNGDGAWSLHLIDAKAAHPSLLASLFGSRKPKEDETANVRAELEREREQLTVQNAALEADAKKWRAEAEQARKEAAEAQRVAEEARRSKTPAKTIPTPPIAPNSNAKRS